MAKNKDNEIIEFPEQKILPVNIENNVRKSFIEYSMSVIVARALPDARDGMKPGQRRVLYSMWEDNLTSDKPFRKSATTVGNVLGRYHPHGDTAVYYTMVRMAQNFSYRYMLVEGHGNFGSVDGDSPAAYRYTEARMSKLSNELLRDIEKETIKWDMNFDNTRREPSVLPSRFPNLLVNGAVGIAVGMATNIPPHNLGEVIDGTVYLMEHPDAGVGELMQFIKGPDFPTGAEIHGTMGIREAYTTGRGRIMVRAKAHIEEEHCRIIITEIPYMVQKSDLIKAMADQVRDKKIEGVTDIRDESGRAGMRIVIEYRRDANPGVILNRFYKSTELESTCAVIMLALVNGEPKVLTLRQALKVYINHQIEVITNRVKFDLEKALHEAHINEGYKIAIDNIDEVITIIRSSPDTPTAKERLAERFALSDEQTQAIVQMTLGRLSGLERQKVENRLAELYAAIDEYRAILGDEGRIRQIIRDELVEIKNKYADERRTLIEEAENEIVPEDLIERHCAVITLTHDGYIKRMPADTYTAQKRGGTGVIGMSTKDEDYIEMVDTADSHSNMMFFTNRGNAHVIKAYRIPEAGRTARGSNIINMIPIEQGEKISAMISVPDLSDPAFREAGDADNFLVMVTRNGMVKRAKLSDYVMHSKKGKKALKLSEGDELIYAGLTHGESDILIASSAGKVLRLDENRVPVKGRTSGCLKGLKLIEGAVCVGACVIDKSEEWNEENLILTVTENGYGKLTSANCLNRKGRGSQGNKFHKTNEKTGAVCSIAVTQSDEDVLIITNDGKLIRIHADGISRCGAYAAGVKMMRLNGERRIVNFTVTARAEEEEEQDESLLLTAEEAAAEAVEDDAPEEDIEETSEDTSADAEESEEEDTDTDETVDTVDTDEE